MSDHTFKPGDVVKHRPSGEEWLVSAVNYDGTRLCPAGWPETIADCADCELIEVGSPEAHDKMVRQCREHSRSDIRKSWNRDRALLTEAGPAGGKPEGP